MNKQEHHRIEELGGARLLRSIRVGWTADSMMPQTGRKPYRVGIGMASDERENYFPERAQRRAERRMGVEHDPLVKKSRFALGEAARRGWAAVIWSSSCARPFFFAKIRAAFEAHERLPLPG